MVAFGCGQAEPFEEDCYLVLENRKAGLCEGGYQGYLTVFGLDRLEKVLLVISRQLLEEGSYPCNLSWVYELILWLLFYLLFLCVDCRYFLFGFGF